MRGGTLLLHLQQFELGRFIPACAGNTTCNSPTTLPPSVHPRMRGEHPTTRGDGGNSGGSSPHARGTHFTAATTHHPLRFIPACAGNTGSWSARRSRGPVHPRMRGEHIHRDKERGQYVGSSPHARGTLAGSVIDHAAERFIPACAGNTPPAWACGSGAAVHPRMRGEHETIEMVQKYAHGSSPHARGTRPYESQRPRLSRFIPACAGNTSLRTSPVPGHAVHPRMRGEHT